MTTQAEALAAIPVSDLTPEQLSAIVAEMCGWRSKVYTMADGSTRIEWDAPKGSGGRIGLPMPPAYATDDGLAVKALEAWAGTSHGFTNYRYQQHDYHVALDDQSWHDPIEDTAPTLALAACRALVAAGRADA